MSIDEMVSELSGGNSQANNGFLVNESERDGNVADLLFFIDQPTLSISGGKTFTNISPSTSIGSFSPVQAAKDLLSGKFNFASLLILGAAIWAGWWLLKK